VTYAKNGQPIHRSAVLPALPLVVRVVLLDQGAPIPRAEIFVAGREHAPQSR
jgi:hypothetical protein